MKGDRKMKEQDIKEILSMLSQMVLSGVNNFKLAAVIASRLEAALQEMETRKGEEESGDKEV